MGRGACHGHSGMVGPVDRPDRPAGLAPAPTLVSAQGLVLTRVDADKLTRATHVAGVLTRGHVTPL